jgi:hypothetical protein
MKPSRLVPSKSCDRKDVTGIQILSSPTTGFILTFLGSSLIYNRPHQCAKKHCFAVQKRPWSFSID